MKQISTQDLHRIIRSTKSKSSYARSIETEPKPSTGTAKLHPRSDTTESPPLRLHGSKSSYARSIETEPKASTGTAKLHPRSDTTERVLGEQIRIVDRVDA
ncbi:hypothetical protein KM043_003408 [Ampulex compressa]|nr:hypothetical protein KM043_003408 [Ampulex compressa]